MILRARQCICNRVGRMHYPEARREPHLRNKVFLPSGKTPIQTFLSTSKAKAAYAHIE